MRMLPITPLDRCSFNDSIYVGLNLLSVLHDMTYRAKVSLALLHFKLQLAGCCYTAFQFMGA